MLPFVLLALLEVGLRIASYGGETPLFEAPEVLRGDYLVPGQNVGRRYFPRERFPPSPPGDAFLAVKPAHSMRLFVMGESSAAGFPFPANGTFSRVLGDALSDILPSDTVEVVNLGMAATNSYTIADLADEVLEQKPDGILIYGGHNEYYGALGAGSTESLGSFPGFVRLYLNLQRFKTLLLMRNAINATMGVMRGEATAVQSELDASRMESVVRDQRITLGGETYRRGVRQYDSNLRSAIGKFRRAGVPVFIGSTPANLRDLRPFGSLRAPLDSSASAVFDSAKAGLARGDSVSASRQFALARDLDLVRFRAPSEFQPLLKRIAAEMGAVYVPAAEAFSSDAAYGIPGNDLFLEHVHPNQRGYVILAKAYFDAIEKAGFLGRQSDIARLASWDEYARRMRLTDLDQRMAYHTVRTVTTRWPFVPPAAQLDYRGTYRPVNLLDSIAFAASRGAMPWATAKAMMGGAYTARGETDRAVAEYEGLIRDQPRIELAHRLAGRALLAANQPERARPFLETAFSLSPTGFTAYSLGVIAMQQRDPARGIPLLERALKLTPDMPPALYQLSLAYAVNRDIERARALALRLAQVEPRFPGLAEWLTTLGIVR